MDINNVYPNLLQFFGGYFPDADFEGLTDKEVVKNYISDCLKSEKSIKELKDTKIELDILIDNLKLWEELTFEANRHFESYYDALKWLEMIKQDLNKTNLI